MIVIGQLMEALKSGKYDPDKTALIMSQTGGGCRASNYIHLLRKALKENNLEQVPVISLNASGLEKHEGFKMYPGLLIKCIYALYYGDLLMYMYNQCKSYEINKGETDRVLDKWIEILKEKFESLKYLKVRELYKNIILDFSKIELEETEKVKVGIVGEIYLKYSPLGNNNLEEFLREDNAEKLEEAVRMDVMLHAYMLVQSGIPMLYSGDEIAQLSDNHYKENPQKAEDSRYIHRGAFLWENAKKRKEKYSVEEIVFDSLAKLEKVRRNETVFDAKADVYTYDVKENKILGILREDENTRFIALFNFGNEPRTAWMQEEGEFEDLFTGKKIELKDVELAAHGFVWAVRRK